MPYIYIYIYLSFDIYKIIRTSCQAFYCTIEKGKCNYRSGLPLSTHRPVTTKNMRKYDSIGDKKEKSMCTHKTSKKLQLFNLRSIM